MKSKLAFTVFIYHINYFSSKLQTVHQFTMAAICSTKQIIYIQKASTSLQLLLFTDYWDF